MVRLGPVAVGIEEVIGSAVPPAHLVPHAARPGSPLRGLYACAAVAGVVGACPAVARNDIDIVLIAAAGEGRVSAAFDPLRWNWLVAWVTDHGLAAARVFLGAHPARLIARPACGAELQHGEIPIPFIGVPLTG